MAKQYLTRHRIKIEKYEIFIFLVLSSYILEKLTLKILNEKVCYGQ